MNDPHLTTIRDYLARTLLVTFGDAPPAVPATEDLFEAGLMDSFAFVQLVSFLEKQFHLKITDEEALSGALVSLASIESFVEEKVRHAGT